VLTYVLSRLAQAVPLVLGILVVNFLIVRLAPGDPVLALVGDFPAPEEYVRQLRHAMGLDRPLATQLGLYLARVAQGDLGYSFAQQRPVLIVIAERIGPTLLLAGTAWLLAAVGGVAVGLVAALRRRSWLDHAAMAAALVGFSMPVFWLGQVLMLLFAIVFGWLPAQGMRATRTEFAGLRYVLDVAAHLALPVLALSTRFLAVNARLTRASMLEVLGREFVTTARAKGAPETSVVLRHGLRNALLPVVTVMGLNLGLLLTGSALVETVFAWPGVGRLLFDSISTRDFPVIQGIFLAVSITVVVANLLTDVLYAYLDPRIRF
jgi:peptide/nickel transport system permease protein